MIPVGLALAVMGITYAILGLVVAMIGYYIFKERRWAYWFTFILSIVGIPIAICGGSIISLIISVIIFVYLYTIREDFSKNKSDVKPVN